MASEEVAVSRSPALQALTDVDTEKGSQFEEAAEQKESGKDANQRAKDERIQTVRDEEQKDTAIEDALHRSENDSKDVREVKCLDDADAEAGRQEANVSNIATEVYKQAEELVCDVRQKAEAKLGAQQQTVTEGKDIGREGNGDEEEEDQVPSADMCAVSGKYKDTFEEPTQRVALVQTEEMQHVEKAAEAHSRAVEAAEAVLSHIGKGDVEGATRFAGELMKAAGDAAFEARSAADCSNDARNVKETASDGAHRTRAEHSEAITAASALSAQYYAIRAQELSEDINSVLRESQGSNKSYQAAIEATIKILKAKQAAEGSASQAQKAKESAESAAKAAIAAVGESDTSVVENANQAISSAEEAGRAAKAARRFALEAKSTMEIVKGDGSLKSAVHLSMISSDGAQDAAMRAEQGAQDAKCSAEVARNAKEAVCPTMPASPATMQAVKAVHQAAAARKAARRSASAAAQALEAARAAKLGSCLREVTDDAEIMIKIVNAAAKAFAAVEEAEKAASQARTESSQAGRARDMAAAAARADPAGVAQFAARHSAQLAEVAQSFAESAEKSFDEVNQIAEEIRAAALRSCRSAVTSMASIASTRSSTDIM